MEINTQFNVGDTAYLLENRECYKCIITVINVVEDGEDLSVVYTVDKIIPKGILKEEKKTKQVVENVMFLSKQAVKEKLQEIEEVNEKADELNKAHPKADIGYSFGWGISDALSVSVN